MKKINILSLFIAMLLLFMASCKSDFLEPDTVSELNEETVFADSARTIAFLTSIYANIDFSFSPTQFGNAGLESACDEAEGYSNGGGETFRQFTTGVVNSSNVTSAPYNTCYKNIRSINLFLKKIIPFKMENPRKRRSIGEAHFLRAWYYFILLKHYGGTPIVGDTVFAADAQINLKRNTFAECVNYIVRECDTAAKLSPVTVDESYFGRADAGMCQALKSCVLLHAASPLFNGENIGYGENRLLVGYDTYDRNRWKRAMDAADSVILIKGVKYKLYEKDTAKDSLGRLPGHAFKKLFSLATGPSNTEFIVFVQRAWPNNSYAALWNPPTRAGGRHAWPYQEMADAFTMNNGLPITDPASGYDPANPYKNRDPRFENSILHNNQIFTRQYFNTTLVAEPLALFAGAKEGDGFGNGTPTGYYIGKLTSDAFPANFYYDFSDICLLRLAEIQLNYAEAANEYEDQPSAFTIGAIMKLRERAGINKGANGRYGIKQFITKAEMRELIRNERRVELAYESRRFWDVRRWKIAEQTENQIMHGMKVTRQGPGDFTYERVTVNRHSFNKAMYFWPIPLAEIQKSRVLVQNPFYSN
ncbi:MAG: RagB/SusD family nutrient uptake outer membrane protein [Mucilaginibacter sp.]